KGADAPGATLAVRPITASGAPGKTVAISNHALSTGGVAVAPAPGKAPEAAIAWVAREHGEPQVVVTMVGADGAKLGQKDLTVISRKGAKPTGKLAKVMKHMQLPGSEPSDVAIASVSEGGDGWIVAWTDTRDRNPEIYVAKVDRSLKKIIPDRRI